MFNPFKTQYQIVSDEFLTEGSYSKYHVMKRGFETFFQWEVFGQPYSTLDDAIAFVNRRNVIRFKTVWRG